MEADLQILRTLCDETKPRDERLKLLDTCALRVFADPEHQVVYESIRALLTRGPITHARLIAHLTNRGFPDVEIEKYLLDS